jgi:hypothetical protein
MGFRCLVDLLGRAKHTAKHSWLPASSCHRLPRLRRMRRLESGPFVPPVEARLGLDLDAWRGETTWKGDVPSLASFWAMVRSPALPESFRSTVVALARGSTLLKACLAQRLKEQGLVSAGAIAEALRAEIGTRPQPATVDALLAATLSRREWNLRFSNLVSGTFTEQAFERAYQHKIEAVGLRLLSETEQSTFVDYRLQDLEEGFALAINLKNAGVQYRESMRWVELDPGDTIPIATYKIFGSEIARIPPLIYVYLVDWTLLPRLRAAYWQSLSELEQQVFRLLACLAHIPRALEGAFIDSTVRDRADLLMGEVGYDPARLGNLPFRVVSAARCRAVFYQQHGRSPYVYRQRMNTDPNVHISVAQETMPFADFLAHHLVSRVRDRLRK